MGEAANPTASKVLIVILIVSVLAISSGQLFYSPSSSTSSQGGNPEPPADHPQDQQLASDPSASGRPVNESAIGFDAATGSGRTVNLPSPGTNDLPVTLTYNWVGTKLYTTVTGVWDQRNWVNNGNFTSNSNGWSFWSRDVRGYTNTISSGWASSGAGGDPGYIWARINGYWDGSYYRYDGGDTMAWNQTVSIPRGTVISAKLEFKYYVVNTPMLNTLGANVYGWVGRSFAFKISYPSMSTPYDSWHYASADIPAANITLPNVLVSIGHYQIGTYGYSALNYVQVYFDEVRLTVKALVKPEQVKLKLAAPDHPNTNCSIISPSPSTYGAGVGTLTGFTIGPPTLQTTYYFDFTSNLTSPASGSFLANASIYATRQKTADTRFMNKGSNIEWNISLATAFESYGQQFSTTGYIKYYFNVSVPSDWSLTTCIDPNGVSHNILAEANNFSMTILGPKAILRVNVTRIGSYSPPPLDTPYVIHALSTNYVKWVKTQLENGSLYVDATKFYPQNWTRFVAYIAGPGGPATSGKANLTISGPPTYGAPPEFLTMVTGVAPNSTGHVNFMVHWNSTNAAGNYTGQVDWVDSLLGEGGSLTCDYNITHKFFMYFAFPATGVDVITANSVLSNPKTTVKVLDYYTNESLTGAEVRGRAQWESPGTSHIFAYSADNIAYTNTTYVPNLTPSPPPTWIAANATKPFYDQGSANTTVNVGTKTICTPLSTPYTVYYTESLIPAFYKDVNVTYYYSDGVTPIPDATITLLSDTSSNDSLVHWVLRTYPDTSKNAEGKYSARIYMFTSSAKGLPAGHSYDIWFRLSKTQSYQTQTFKMTLVVEGQPTVLNVWTGNQQSVFWGHTALVQINFTTQQAGSGHDWPVSHLPISNLSYYIPPYVSVTVDQGTHKWVYNWTVEPDPLYPGTYNLYFDTQQFPTPTPGETPPYGTQVQIDVGFHKPNYNDPTGMPITLYIKSLTTRLTSTVPANATTTYSGDLKTILVWYNDTHTGVPVGVGGSTITYTSSGGNILGSGTLNAVAGTPGLYNLTLSGATTSQIPGTYQIYLVGSNSPHYVQRSITVTLNILALPTALQAYNSTATIYYLDSTQFLIWYNDTHNNAPIGGATFIVSVPPGFINPYLNPVSGFPGLYNLTVPAGNGIGDYAIDLTANKSKYVDGTEVITVHINRLPTLLVSYIVADGSALVQTNATVQQGTQLTIYLWFNNTHSNIGIGVEHSITFSSAYTRFGNGWASQVAGHPGLYAVTFQTADTGNYTVDFDAGVTGYDSQSFTFKVSIYRLPTVLVSYTLSKDTGAVLAQPNATVPEGGTVTIYLWFNDTRNGSPVAGVEHSIWYSSSYARFGTGVVSPVAGYPGLYNVTFYVPEAGVFTVIFLANVTGYEIQSLTFTVTVQAPPPGFSPITVMLVGFGGGGIVVVGAVAWVLLRRARIPFIIKKIDETIKLIGKGDHEGATPIALRSREEIIVGITQERVDAFTARRPVKGAAAEEAPAEEAPAVGAPPAGEAAALKTELEAVETKEKPGEAIEEVEMDTLDQELQKLEKFEDKEQLPDGAKEVRDVIEKYKEGKKKK